jgi:hypothetical protein
MPVELNGYLMIVVQKRLVGACGTLASVATDMLRVLARNTLVVRMSFVQNKNGPLARTILLIIGAQKRTRT